LNSFLKFFSEISDIDNKIVRTVVTLFRSPTKVIDAYISGETLYVKPLRYAISTSSLYIVIQYLYELFFNSIEIGKWWLPTRINDADAQFSSLFQALFPIQILITAIPIAILLFKLLFYLKSWKEAMVVILYAIAQFWIMMLFFIPVLLSENTFDGLIALTCFVIVFVSFRNVMYGHIILRIGKWLAMTVLLIIWFYKVSLDLTQFTLTKFLKDYSPATVKSSMIEPLKVTTLNAKNMFVVQGDPGNRFLEIESESNGIRAVVLNADGSVQGETFIPGVDRIRKVISIALKSNRCGLLVLTDSLGLTSHAFLLSSDAKILYKKSYHEFMVLNGGGLSKGRTLILVGGKVHHEEIVPFIDVINLHDAGDKLLQTSERNLILPNPRQRFEEIYPIDSAGTLTAIATKYQSNNKKYTTYAMEIVNISILKLNLDSVITTDWEKEIFRKTSMYSPLKDETFKTVVDTANNRILATYGLANDSTLVSHLFNLSGDGQLVWEKRISENNLTSLSYLYSHQSGIYFSGSVSSGINNPITFGYRQGIFGHVSADGNVISAVRYGKTSHGQSRTFDKLIITDTLSIYSFNVRVGYLATQTGWELLKFKK